MKGDYDDAVSNAVGETSSISVLPSACPCLRTVCTPVLILHSNQEEGSGAAVQDLRIILVGATVSDSADFPDGQERPG